MSETLQSGYRVVFANEGALVDQDDDNVDVFVYFDDGRKYVATFFTLRNLSTIMARHSATGESAGGIYFWAADAIIVARLERPVIERAIADLLANETFELAFDGPHPTDDDGA